MDLLRWGHLCKVTANFILNKANFTIEYGQFDENLMQHKIKFGCIEQTAPRRSKYNNK
jgi:hypothetical protein